MKPLPARLLRLCAILIACMQLASLQGQDPAPAQERPKVNAITIQHVGPAAVSEELVRANIRVREGDPYSRVIIDDDVRNLHGTGYFYNIRVLEEVSTSGVRLTYVVQGKPVLTEVRFSGNKRYSISRLRRKVTSKVGEPLDQQKLFKDSQEIEKLYQKAGMQKTKVEAKPVINESLGRGTVTFEVTEAPKIRIDDVRFENASVFSQKKLRKVIKTRRHWMFSWITGSGKLKDDQFEEDKEKLHDFYGNHGYIDYELKDVRQEPHGGKNTNRIILHLDVSEGTQYRVGSLQIQGNELFSTNAILPNLRSKDGEKVKRGIRLKEGAVFAPKDLEKDVEALRDFYGEQGYIDAQVVPQKSANIDKGTMDIVQKISEGDKSYVEKIEIRGNTKTRDKVIRRELAITPGETFDMARVKASKSILEQTRFFEKVDTTTEETDIPNRKTLVIGVEEANTGNIAVGAGFSSVDSVVGFVEVSQGNFDLFNPPYFTGGGQKARLRAQFGTKRQDYVLTFIEPWFLGKRLELTTELFHRDLRYFSDNFEQQETGGRIGLRKALPFNFEAGVHYSLETVGLKFSNDYKTNYPTSPILQDEGHRLVSQVGTSIAHDTRNNVLLASKGHRVELSGEVAGGPVGGDTDFYRLEARAAQYFSPPQYFKLSSGWEDFFQNHILELSGRVGVISAYGEGDRGTKDRVPFFERYFLGGVNNLRGYKYRTVGPRDFTSREPLGGGTYWYGTAEYSVPVIERVRFAVFYDVGMVYQDAYSFSTKGFNTDFYNDNYGLGLRLNLPIGPLRLDYGIPINNGGNNSSSGKFQFSVGWQREF